METAAEPMVYVELFLDQPENVFPISSSSLIENPKTLVVQLNSKFLG
jgi:hypothetical protein